MTTTDTDPGVAQYIAQHTFCPHQLGIGKLADRPCCGSLRALLRQGDFAGFGRQLAEDVLAARCAGELHTTDEIIRLDHDDHDNPFIDRSHLKIVR
jgi:hypothetical protein